MDCIGACADPDGWAFAATVGHKFKATTGQALSGTSTAALEAGWIERRGSPKTIQLRVVKVTPAPEPRPDPKPVSKAEPKTAPLKPEPKSSTSTSSPKHKSLDASFADLLEVFSDRSEKEPEWLPITKVAERLFQRTGGELSEILPCAIETGVIECDKERGRIRVTPGF